MLLVVGARRTGVTSTPSLSGSRLKSPSRRPPQDSLRRLNPGGGRPACLRFGIRSGRADSVSPLGNLTPPKILSRKEPRSRILASVEQLLGHLFGARTVVGRRFGAQSAGGEPWSG